MCCFFFLKVCRQYVNARIPQGLAEMCKRDTTHDWTNTQSLLEKKDQSLKFTLTNTLVMINHAFTGKVALKNIPNSVSQHWLNVQIINHSVIYVRLFNHTQHVFISNSFCPWKLYTKITVLPPPLWSISVCDVFFFFISQFSVRSNWDLIKAIYV